MKKHEETEKMNITRKLLLIFGSAFALFFFVWLFLFMKDPSGSQRGVMFTDGNDFFMDWFNVVYYSIGKKPYIWGLTEERSLPPLTYLLLYPFSKLYDYDVTGWVENESRYDARFTQLPMTGFLIVFIISYLLLFYSLYKTSRKSRIIRSDLGRAFLFLILFLSGVNLYCLDRGNLQVVTAAAVFLYIFLCDDDNKDTKFTVCTSDSVADNVSGCVPDDSSAGAVSEGVPYKIRALIGCFCLAFAAALKIFPAVMGILLIYKKKWKKAVCAFVIGVALYIIPFLWLDMPFTEAVSAFISTLAEHAASYMTVAEFGFSTNVITSLTGISHGALQIMAYIAALLTLCTAWSLKGWKKIMLLMLMLVMTSGQQGYYCLMFLFLPIVMFFNEEHRWSDVIYVLAFAIILSPLQRTAHFGAVDIPARAVINMVMLLLYLWLLICAVRAALAKSKSDLRQS